MNQIEEERRSVTPNKLADDDAWVDDDYGTSTPPAKNNTAALQNRHQGHQVVAHQHGNLPQS